MATPVGQQEAEKPKRSTPPSSRMSPFSKSSGERILPPQMSTPPAKPMTNEASSLLNGSNGNAQAVNHYLVDDSDAEDDPMFTPSERKPKFTKLINFWASVVAQLLSVGLIALSSYLIWPSRQPTSALILTACVGVLLGCVSLTVEIAHCIPKACPKFLHWALGKHALLHLLTAILSILPYWQVQRLLGTVYLLFIVPACLYYTAKARREPLPSWLYKRQQQKNLIGKMPPPFFSFFK